MKKKSDEKNIYKINAYSRCGITLYSIVKMLRMPQILMHTMVDTSWTLSYYEKIDGKKKRRKKIYIIGVASHLLYLS